MSTGSDQPAGGRITRYGHGERLTHWAVALAYLVLFFSGLAMFHPFFFWLSGVFGGAAFMRVLHPFVGVAFAVLFYAWAAQLWRDNLLLPSDRPWISGMFRYMNQKGDDVPVEGKYNAGQKLMYWSMIVVILALIVTGVVLWRPYFTGYFELSTRRVAGLAHAVAAFIMFVGIGVHVYAAFWTKGSIRAMTRGYVSRAWARHHHPGWLQRAASKERT